MSYIHIVIVFAAEMHALYIHNNHLEVNDKQHFCLIGQLGFLVHAALSKMRHYMYRYGLWYYNIDNTKSIIIRKYATHIVVLQTSLSGFDVSMWLQHPVLVPQLYSDRP